MYQEVPYSLSLHFMNAFFTITWKKYVSCILNTGNIHQHLIGNNDWNGNKWICVYFSISNPCASMYKMWDDVLFINSSAALLCKCHSRLPHILNCIANCFLCGLWLSDNIEMWAVAVKANRKTSVRWWKGTRNFPLKIHVQMIQGKEKRLLDAKPELAKTLRLQVAEFQADSARSQPVFCSIRHPPYA